MADTQPESPRVATLGRTLATDNEQRETIKILKIELKTWEREFFKQHARKPTKDDILKEKPIAKKYKQYGKLKAQMGEGLDSNTSLNGSNGDITAQIGLKPGVKTAPRPQSPLTSPTIAISPVKSEENADASATNVATVKSQSPTVATSIVQQTNYDGEAPNIATETTPIPDVLRSPQVAFRSAHPLLANLSFVPKTVSPPASRPGTAVSPPRNSIRNSRPWEKPDLEKRIPAGQVLRCRVERKDGVAPIYTLVNESSGATLMSAKRKLGLGVHFTVYQGNSVRAEVRGNGPQFSIHDATASGNVLPNMAAVCFEKHFLPRKLKCIIKGANTPDDYKEHYSADLIRNLNENVGENTMILTSREPTIDNETKLYTLNFAGRVTVPSVKNFQLADKTNNLVLQFGRVGEDSFALDAFYPMTPVEAFCIALTSFDHKSSV